MKDNVINIAAFLGQNLKSRIVVRDFHDKILSQNMPAVVLDFKDVIFATRSFMDEFYNVFLCNNIVEANLINLSPELEKMLNTVKDTQHKSAKAAIKVFPNSELKFSSISQVNKYLEKLSFT